MIKTIKNNSYMVVKLALNQIGMTVFGLVLYFASIVSESREIMAFTSLFSICFYMVLLYTTSRDAGLVDQIRIESGRMHYQPLKFLWLSLCANLLNILAGIAVISHHLLTIGAESALPAWINNIAWVAVAYVYLTEGMYLGVLNVVFNLNKYMFLVIVLPAIIVTTLGYIFGTHGGIRAMLVKNKSNDKK